MFPGGIEVEHRLKWVKVIVRKCFFLYSLGISTSISQGNYTITNSNSEKVLGIKVDRKVSFTEHIKLRDKGSKKMQPLTLFFLICPKLKEKKLIEFLLSQFEYCHPSMGLSIWN